MQKFTLGLIFSILTFAPLTGFAQDFGFPACYNDDGSGNSALSQGDYCVDNAGVPSKVTQNQNKGKRLDGQTKYKFKTRQLSGKEIKRLVAANSRPATNTGGNTGGGGRRDGDDDDNTGGGRQRGAGGNANTGGGARRGNSGRQRAQNDVDILAKHCGDNGDLIDYDKTRQSDLDGLKDDLKKYTCRGDDCINLADLKAQMMSAMKSCRGACIKIAMNNDDGNACSAEKRMYPTLADVPAFCANLTISDRDNPPAGLAAFMRKFKDQSECRNAIVDGTSSDQLCKSLTDNKNCFTALTAETSDFDCQDFNDAAKNYREALDAYNKVKTDIKILEKRSVRRDCTITTAADFKKFDKDAVSISCLVDIQSSCIDALQAANDKYDELDSSERIARKAYCPTCNDTEQTTSCMYGGQCNGGISKFAQGASAIMGGLVPLGLGAFNLAAQYKSINACVNSSNQLAQYQTQVANNQIALYQNVGLTGPIGQVTGGNCFGGGMAGFNGFSGGVAGGGYASPFGLGANIGGGMYPSGYGLGVNGGIGANTGMYPNYSAGMGIGLNGGFNNGIGTNSYTPGMYNNQYGLGVNGMGMQNQYGLNAGLYGNNLYQSQANMGSVIQQMNAQSGLIAQQGYGLNNYGLGVNGQLGYNQAYPNYSSGYSYPGMNFNAGINLGIGGGAYTGYQGYQGYPYQGGYNQMYPNYGLGVTGTSACGYYASGIPCSN